MREPRRFVHRVMAVFGAALVLSFGVYRGAHAQEASYGSPTRYHAGAAYLDQGWGYDTAQWWYYVSQGTLFMPYPWFLALEQSNGGTPVQAGGEQLFAAPDHLERLGFLADGPSAHNPRGLPVGFAVRPLDIPTDVYGVWKGEWVGFACAACHTGQVRYHGQQIRIEGGPSHLDIEGFGDELTAALTATASNGPRLERFAARVAALSSGVTADDVKLKFKLFVGFQAARRSLFDAAQAASPELPTSAGLGRLDAVHRGGNLLLSAPLAEPRNYVPTTAPVSYPALWDTPYFDWVLYNASIRQPLARNVIEALGVQAPIDPRTFLTGPIVHGVLMDNVVAIHRSLTRLQSPRWPEDILGRIDLDKARQGEAVYRQACAACHLLIDRATHTALTGGGDEIKVTVVPLDQVGTDPRQATNFANRVITLGKIGGPTDVPYMKAAEIVSGRVVEQWKSQSAANAEIEAEIDRGRPNEFRGLLAYRARPLNGIWATAPYLHNGSVPTLYDLLLPPARRPKVFYVGSWELDPAHVGVESASPFAGAFTFDTRLPGNSNGGHAYGTTLDEADRLALIEFLKTL